LTFTIIAVAPFYCRNLGVVCINIGCYPEAAQHLLGALAIYRVVEEQGLDRARQIVGDGGMYDTLRRAFNGMKRSDLSDRVGVWMSLDAFRGEFDFQGME
jgi:peroxin-5